MSVSCSLNTELQTIPGEVDKETAVPGQEGSKIVQYNSCRRYMLITTEQNTFRNYTKGRSLYHNTYNNKQNESFTEH